MQKSQMQAQHIISNKTDVAVTINESIVNYNSWQCNVQCNYGIIWFIALY